MQCTRARVSQFIVFFNNFILRDLCSQYSLSTPTLPTKHRFIGLLLCTLFAERVRNDELAVFSVEELKEMCHGAASIWDRNIPDTKEAMIQYLIQFNREKYSQVYGTKNGKAKHVWKENEFLSQASPITLSISNKLVSANPIRFEDGNLGWSNQGHLTIELQGVKYPLVYKFDARINS
eukprot:TRINITY_DN6881_c0_g1_i1.p1 TRINITY_DN6881_c0_g1~~TRINITY_DN6881_c0_g1_i1.p1  ORF type:complete len:178 (-),score=7.53 TRINITY_DN6881_c0_g1_i1:15-548(-)